VSVRRCTIRKRTQCQFLRRTYDVENAQVLSFHFDQQINVISLWWCSALCIQWHDSSSASTTTSSASSATTAPASNTAYTASTCPRSLRTSPNGTRSSGSTPGDHVDSLFKLKRPSPLVCNMAICIDGGDDVLDFLQQRHAKQTRDDRGGMPLRHKSGLVCLCCQ